MRKKNHFNFIDKLNGGCYRDSDWTGGCCGSAGWSSTASRAARGRARSCQRLRRARDREIRQGEIITMPVSTMIKSGATSAEKFNKIGGRSIGLTVRTGTGISDWRWDRD